MVGRGTRLYEGQSDCAVFGFNWKTFGHKLVSPVQLFGADIDEETQQLASFMVENGTEKDLLSAMKKAKAEKRHREKLRIEIEEKKVAARKIRFDPLAYDPDFAPAVVTQSGGTWELPPTEKQTSLLEKLGWKPAEFEGWTKARATAEIGQEFARRDKGLATRRQLKTLRSFRVPNADAMSKAEASAMLDSLMGARR
jgi:hypothetical protein